jgi:RNA 3'-terminal phosphate cyclase (ATP)
VLTFEPRTVRAGNYSFSIGTAGSCTLVLQTILPPLLTASAPSVVRISGGTHNKAAPPFEFLKRAFLPLLARMGASVELTLERHGFYPRGGGVIEARIEPARHLTPIALTERGALARGYAEAFISAVPLHVASRELAVVATRGVSSFVTTATTPHFESNAEVIRAFTGKRVSLEQNGSSYTVTMR